MGEKFKMKTFLFCTKLKETKKANNISRTEYVETKKKITKN